MPIPSAASAAPIAQPKVLLLDELSTVLAPMVIRQIFSIISVGGMVLVEQGATQAPALSHRAYVLETGRIVTSGDAADLDQRSGGSGPVSGRRCPGADLTSCDDPPAGPPTCADVRLVLGSLCDGAVTGGSGCRQRPR